MLKPTSTNLLSPSKAAHYMASAPITTAPKPHTTCLTPSNQIVQNEIPQKTIDVDCSGYTHGKINAPHFSPISKLHQSLCCQEKFKTQEDLTHITISAPIIVTQSPPTAKQAASQLGKEKLDANWPNATISRTGEILHFIDSTGEIIDSIDKMFSLDQQQTNFTQAKTTHERAMDFLEKLDFFENIDGLLSVGTLVHEAHKAIQELPKTLRPVVLDHLEIKKKVAESLMDSPVLYQKLENIRVLKNHFDDDSLFDSSGQTQHILNTLHDTEIPFPSTKQLSNATILQNIFLKDYCQKLNDAEQNYRSSLEIFLAIATMKEGSKDASKKAARNDAIENLQQHTHHYLNILSNAMTYLANQDETWLISREEISAVKQKTKIYLDRLDQIVRSYLSQQGLAIGQKKIKFPDLCDAFFSQRDLLPIDDKFHQNQPLAEKLQEKLDTMLSQARLLSKDWASNAVTKFLTDYLQKEDCLGNNEEILISTQTAIVKKLLTENPPRELVSLPDALITPIIETLDQGNLFFDVRHLKKFSSSAYEKMSSARLKNLKEVGILSQAAYEMIAQEPTHMQPFLLQYIEQKSVLQTALKAHLPLVIRLTQLKEAHDAIVRAIDSGLSEQQKAQIQALSSLPPTITSFFSAAQMNINRSYQAIARSLKEAEKIYRQAMFSETETTLSLFDHAMSLCQSTDNIRKLPSEFLPDYIRTKRDLSDKIKVLIHNYLKTTYTEMGKFERAGEKMDLCAQDFQSFIEQEYSPLVDTTASLQSLLDSLQDCPFLPKKKSNLSALAIPFQIEKIINEKSAQIKEEAYQWLFNASIETLKENASTLDPLISRCDEQVELIRFYKNAIKISIQKKKVQQRNEQRGDGLISNLACLLDHLSTQADGDYNSGEGVNSSQWNSRELNQGDRTGLSGKRHDSHRHFQARMQNYPRYHGDSYNANQYNSRHASSEFSTTKIWGNQRHAQAKVDADIPTSMEEQKTIDRQTAKKALRDVLKLPRQANDFEIKHGYLKAMLSCHPDKVAHQPTANQNQAKERYDLLHSLYTKWEDRHQ